MLRPRRAITLPHPVGGPRTRNTRRASAGVSSQDQRRRPSVARRRSAVSELDRLGDGPLSEWSNNRPLCVELLQAIEGPLGQPCGPSVFSGWAIHKHCKCGTGYPLLPPAAAGVFSRASPGLSHRSGRPSGHSRSQARGRFRPVGNGRTSIAGKLPAGHSHRILFKEAHLAPLRPRSRRAWGGAET